MFKLQGSSLAIVLFLLCVMSLLIWQSLEQSILANKLSSYAEQEAKIEAIAEKNLRETAKNFLNYQDKKCIYPTLLPNDYPAKPAVWWKNNVKCFLLSGAFRSYFILEKVVDDYCVEIIGRGGGLINVDFYRLTIKTERSSSPLSVLLQSSIAVKSAELNSCTKARGHLKLGIQSWRRILEAG